MAYPVTKSDQSFADPTISAVGNCTESNLTLFLALCGALFLALNLLSLKVFLNTHQNVESKIATVRTKIIEAKEIIALWPEAEKWWMEDPGL